MLAVGAGGGDGGFGSAGVAEEGEAVGVEAEGEEAAGAKGLPAAMIADGERGGATAVVEDHGLGFAVQGILDGGEELIGEEAVSFEVSTVFKIDYLKMGGGLVFDSEFA